VILLDTHAWLWWLQPNAREMPEGTRKFIASANEPVGVASVSCLEVAWLVKKGRVALPVPTKEFFVLGIERAGLDLVPLTPNIAARSAELPDIHRDPIDRILIATALELNATFVSRDTVIATYPDVRMTWSP
jgi:PIN domain nuclease of toxin-antitoxin system